jgi:acyl-CoA oxidase
LLLDIDGFHLAAGRFLAAKVHCLNQLYSCMRSSIPKADPSIRPILTSLCGLFGLNSILENAGSFLQFGYFKPQHVLQIEAKIASLIETIRPQVIPLTDAFGLSDYVVNSPLGCYDGDVYRRLMDRVIQSNPQKPHEYFERTIKPVLLRTKKEREVIQLKD